jgi:hypothetical protein
MCTCASCTYTDALADKGFDAWPRGEPAGKLSSERAYAAHVRHSWHGARKRAELGPCGAAFYGGGKLAAEVLARTFARQVDCDWVPTEISPAEEETGQAEAQPVSPAAPCKAPQHFPAPDRQRGACRIYAMRKDQPKRSRGRPVIEGRRVVIKLGERDIERARELGGGGKQAIAAGVRVALRQSSG